MTIQDAESWRTGVGVLDVNPVAGDAHDQAALAHSGDTAPIELVRRAIERVERLNPAINAISHRAFSEACQRAESLPRGAPMRGVPYLVKDSLQYVGMPSKCGSRLLAAALPETRQHAFADRLDAAGLVAIGKSTVPEFSLLPTTESTLYGDTRNPWAVGRSAGGSSGGAAAAVAAGIVPVAHGSDGGGSIRIPASCCGLPGLKPSRGANVRARDFHFIEDILVGDGLLTRSVRDLAWFARLLRPDDALQRPVKRQLRIALCLNDTLNMAPHPEVADVVARAANLCRQLGHEVEIPSRLPASTELTIPTFRALWSFLTRALVDGLQCNAPTIDVESMLEPSTMGLADAGRRLSPNALAEAYRVIGEVDRATGDFFRQYDVLLSPVLGEVPPPLGHLGPRRDFEALAQDLFSYIAYTALANLAGLPSMTLPLFPSASGLPVGTMFTASHGGDELLLSLAAELEAAEPWGGRWPMLAPA